MSILSYTRRRLAKFTKTLDDKFPNPYKNGIFYKMPLTNGAVLNCDRRRHTRRRLGTGLDRTAQVSQQQAFSMEMKILYAHGGQNLLVVFAE